jgi:hypothetical protein
VHPLLNWRTPLSGSTKKPPKQNYSIYNKKTAFKPMGSLASRPFHSPLTLFLFVSQLEEMGKKRIIDSYEVKVQRVNKLCYEVTLHVLAEKSETQKMITQYIQRTFKSLMDFKS